MGFPVFDQWAYVKAVDEPLGNSCKVGYSVQIVISYTLIGYALWSAMEIEA